MDTQLHFSSSVHGKPLSNGAAFHKLSRNDGNSPKLFVGHDKVFAVCKQTYVHWLTDLANKLNSMNYC